MKSFKIFLTAMAVYVIVVIIMQLSEVNELEKGKSAETKATAGTMIVEHYEAGAVENAELTAQNTAVNCEEKRIAITFDDGPHPVYTLKLLEGLKERGVRATFFLVGSLVEQYPEIVQQMAEDGHLIGCHTYSHVQLTSLSLRDACDELEATNNAIFEACGYTVTYVRPPYGLWSDVLNCSFDLTEVGWTIDPEDWKVLNTNTVVKHVLSHAEDEGIILLHDIYETSVNAALEIIDRLRADGWEFVTVDEVILD